MNYSKAITHHHFHNVHLRSVGISSFNHQDILERAVKIGRVCPVRQPFHEVFGAADLVASADAIDGVEEIVMRDVETRVHHFASAPFLQQGYSANR